MRCNYLLLLALSSTMVMCGTGSLALPAPPTQQTSSASSSHEAGDHPHEAEQTAATEGMRAKKHADEQQHNRTSSRNLGHSPADPTRVNRPRPLLNNRERLANTTDVHRQVQGNSGGVVEGAFMQGKGSKRSVPAPTGGPPSMRHRGPNPPIVAGSGNSTSWNTGSINGTRIDRRR